VRAASAAEETKALRERVANAIVSARARGCQQVLLQFRECVEHSRAIMCRSLSVVQRIVASDSAMYATFYQEVDAGIRLPEDNRWDRGRGSVDQALFPHYARNIVSAALTVDGRGLTGYGPYAIVLRDEMIQHRASVFEENPFSFMTRHKVVTGDPLPPGFRAVWTARDQLAMAKLHSRLDASTAPCDFAHILLTSGATPEQDDFIEVHIFGPIHRRAIERVVGPKPRRNERALVASLRAKLRDVGADLETV